MKTSSNILDDVYKLGRTDQQFSQDDYKELKPGIQKALCDALIEHIKLNVKAGYSDTWDAVDVRDVNQSIRAFFNQGDKGGK